MRIALYSVLFNLLDLWPTLASSLIGLLSACSVFSLQVLNRLFLCLGFFDQFLLQKPRIHSFGAVTRNGEIPDFSELVKDEINLSDIEISFLIEIYISTVVSEDGAYFVSILLDRTLEVLLGLASDLSNFIVGIDVVLNVMELYLATNLHVKSTHQ